MKLKKTTTKVAEKTAKAKTKAKRKVARKCAKAALLAAALGAIAGCLEGCLQPTVPSRSQTQMFDHCKFNFYGGGADTNELARVELGTQAMAIETSGTESQTVTPTQTTDVKPDVDVTVGGKATGGGLLESAVSALTKGDAAQAATKAATDCADGSCSTGDCADGSCAAQ